MNEQDLTTLDLSIVIINWNSYNYLRDCLESIYSTAGDFSFEVFVVDNASYDGCSEMLATEFPGAMLLQNSENVGFARANNLGFARSSGRNVLFLNPDTVVLKSALRNMMEALDYNETVGIVGARILNANLSLQTTCIMPVPSLLNQIFDYAPIRNFYTWRRLESKSARQTNLKTVASISGACMMVKRTVMEEVGGFCVHYFMYVEDIDLCLRIKQAGWKVCHMQAAEIIHYGGGSSTHSASHFGSVMIRESVFRFFLLRRQRWYAGMYRPTTAAVAFCRILVLAMLSPVSSTPHQASISLAKWKSVLAWSFDRSQWSQR